MYKQPQQLFMPAFPKKSHKPKAQTPRVKPPNQVHIRVSSKLCKELCIVNSSQNFNTKILRYHNQINFCEIPSQIMTPIRLTNVEISLPNFSLMPTPKTRPRKISTAASRRRSVETKHSVNNIVKVPEEIITTRFPAKYLHENKRPMGIRTSNCSMLSKSGHFMHSLMKNERANRSNYNYPPRRIATGDNRVIESDSGSPTAYSPIYTNNFDF